MSWQPFHLKQCMTHMLHYHQTEHQWSANNIWSCILGNQGFVLINELITKLLTAFIAKDRTYNGKNPYSKKTNVADWKTCNKWLLAVKYLILIIYNYPTAKTRTLYKSTDGPAGRLAGSPPNSDMLGDFHRTVPELTVQVYWQPGPPICQQFGSDSDPDPKWQSTAVANTSCEYWVCITICITTEKIWKPRKQELITLCTSHRYSTGLVMDYCHRARPGWWYHDLRRHAVCIRLLISLQRNKSMWHGTLDSDMSRMVESSFVPPL